MKDKLTKKQEKYVQNLIKGMSQREAYKNSYNASKMKDNTIDRNACELLKNSKVATRYNELLEKLRKKDEENAIITAEKRRKWLTDIILGKEKDIFVGKVGNVPIPVETEVNLVTKLKAMDILNKMDGEYLEKRQTNVTMSYEEELKKVVDEDEY